MCKETQCDMMFDGKTVQLKDITNELENVVLATFGW